VPLVQTFANASARGWGDFLPSGATSSYDLISTTVVSSAVGSVTFSGLGDYSSIYKHLQIRFTGKLNDNIGSTAYTMRFNADGGNNYSTHGLLGNGSSVTSSATTSTSYMNIGNMPNGNGTNIWGASIVDIIDAFSSSKNKTVKALSGQLDYANHVLLNSGVWLSTASTTSLTIYPNVPTGGFNIRPGSRFSIYGIRG
jgi:hypothetical protein